MDRLSESLLSSMLYRIKTHGTASATAINAVFFVFFFDYIKNYNYYNWSIIYIIFYLGVQGVY